MVQQLSGQWGGQQFKEHRRVVAPRLPRGSSNAGKGARGGQTHGNVIRFAYVSIKLANLDGRYLMEMIALLCACDARTQSQNHEPSKTSRLIYCASHHCTTSRIP